MKNASAFFAFARERHSIYLKRAAGEPPPWTADPILAKYKFTNVFRELDRTTAWFREHVREPLRNDPRVLFATVAFRWFNKIETAEYLLHVEHDPSWWEGSLFEDWDVDTAERRLRSALPKGPYVNGAYIIKTPDGMDKLKGVLWCIEQFRQREKGEFAALMATEKNSLQDCWAYLTQYPYLGDFMAYEVVTDLRHTYLLEHAPDIMTWANPGPGACRGYGRVTGEGIDRYDRGKERDRKTVIKGMRELLAMSRDPQHWPAEWPAWEMREVEHVLCEEDKYLRAKLGEGKPKQLFRGGTT